MWPNFSRLVAVYVNELHQTFFLAWGHLWLATAAMAGDHAVETPQEQGLLPVIEARRTQPPALAQYRNGHVMHQQIDQHGGTSHQPHIIFAIGVLETAVEVFDGRGTKRYPDSHGCIFLWSFRQGFVARYTRFLMEASPKFPICFLKIYSCVPRV